MGLALARIKMVGRAVVRAGRAGAAVCAALLLWSAAGARAANPEPVQTFYLPIPEDQLFDAWTAIENGGPGTAPGEPIQSYVSIATLVSNTVMYYDHWEGGFELNVVAPTNAYDAVANPLGTQIWGDGNTTNGSPPGFSTDIVPPGSIILLTNAIFLANRGGTNYFDGGDKLAASKPIAVVRAGWSTGPNTLLTDANEVFDTASWGTAFRVPVGQNISNELQNQIFEYIGASIMAGVGGATVQIDTDADGVYERTNTLDEGQATLVNGGLNVGARILASRPVQMDLITGDVASNYESRFMRLLPTVLWAGGYANPVSSPNSLIVTNNSTFTGTATTVWLYNPAASAITVTYTTRGGANPQTTVLVSNTTYTATNVTFSGLGNVYGPVLEGGTTGYIAPAARSNGAWIALVDLSATTVSQQMANARNSGASAVMLANTNLASPNALPTLSLGGDLGTNGTEWLPVVAVSRNAGQSIRANGYGVGNVRIMGDQVSTALSVPGGAAGGYLRVVVTNGYASRFVNATNAPFYAVCAIESTSGNNGNQAWDWGFALTPVASLTPQVLIGLGLGRDPTSPTWPGENGNPIWISTVGNGNTPATVYVDYDGDPDTGPLVDPNGYRYDLALTLREYERIKLYNPSGDQTGILFYTLDDGVKLVAAWGQDHYTASPGAPGLDLGTAIPPYPMFVASKRSILLTDTDNDGFISPGDTLEYAVTIINASRLPVPDLSLEDTLPNSVTYITNTTLFVNNAGVTNGITDDVVPPAASEFPMDEGGQLLPEASLPVGGTWQVIYQVRILDYEDLPPGTIDIQNAATISGVNITSTNITVTPIRGRIGNFVWFDGNGDGLQTAGETGINGATVSLLDAGGQPVLDGGGQPISVVTTNDGFGQPGSYVFYGITAGTYVVQFALPYGYVFTTQNVDAVGVNSGTNSDPNRLTGRTASFTLAGGQTNMNVDAGAQPSPTLGDYVWNDADNDGVQDPGETGIDGVLVYVDLDSDGAFDPGEPSAITTNGGAYTIAGPPLDAGAFTVRVDTAALPAGWLAQTYDLDGTITAHRATATLTPAQNRTDVDFGYRWPASPLTIAKASGAGADPLFPDDTNTYTITIGNTGLVTQTGIHIIDLLPNTLTYLANSTLVTGYKPTGAATGTVRDTFQNVAYTNNYGSTNWSGNWTESADGGSAAAGRIRISGGELLFQQLNNDTIYRSVNLAGVTNAILTLDYRETSLEATNDYVAVQIATNAAGPWTEVLRFNDAIADGTLTTNITTWGAATTTLRFYYGGPLMSSSNDIGYIDNVQIAFAGPGGPGLVTNDNVNGGVYADISNGVPQNMVIPADGFELAPGQTMSVAFRAIVTNSIPPGVTNLINIAGVRSDQYGLWQYAAATNPLTPRPPSAIGDYVWEDANGNGQQDPGETGLVGVVINLYTGDVVIATTTSTVAGAYLFAGLTAGTYSVAFTPPSGYQFTTSNVGADATDSDPQAGTNRTAAFAISYATTNLTVDAGLYRPASLSGFVLVDLNGNGVVEPGDTNPIPSVTLQLRDAASNVVATTTTSATGAYSFTNLPPGTYTVHELDPAGVTSTYDTQGPNDNVIAVTLVSGQHSTGNNFYDTGSLGITKTSSMQGFDWGAGATNTYTIVVSNTGGLVQTGVELTDPLGSADIAYVPGSTEIIWWRTDTNVTTNVTTNVFSRTVADNFGTVSYFTNDGTTNWLGEWVETGESDGATNGEALVTAGEARIRLSRSLQRGVDLTGATNVVLSFTAREAGTWEPDDVFHVSVSSNGGVAWAGLYYTNDDWTSTSQSFTLTNFFAPNTFILFGTTNVGVDGPAEYAYFDSVQVAFAGRTLITNSVTNLYTYAVTNAGLPPPTLMTNWYLAPGTSVTVRFKATLNSFYAFADITNIASVTSVEQPWPRTASVTDVVAQGTARIGDRVWLDANTNGIQDVGELGYTNVTVRLYDSDTNLLQSLQTDTTGWYSFTNLLPYSYFVEFVAPPGYALSPPDQGGNDNRDSDPGSDGRTTIFPLAGGQVATNWDAGLYREQTDVGVVKSVNDDYPGTNEVIWFSMTVTNNGPLDATGVTFTDFWPASQITFLSYGATHGAYNGGSGLWTIGDLAVGESATLVVTGRMNVVYRGTQVTNVIGLTAMDQFDTNPLNNTSQVYVVTAVILAGVEGVWLADGVAGLGWTTVSEIGTVGFRVWAESAAAGWQLASGFVPSVPGASQGAVYRVPVVRPADATGRYRLEEIEQGTGRKDYGPFQIAWPSARSTAMALAPMSVDVTPSVAPRGNQAGAMSILSVAAQLPLDEPPAAGWVPVKLGVDAERMVRVTAAELATLLGVAEADVSARLAAGQFALYHRDNRVAVEIEPAGVAFRFFGRAVRLPETWTGIFMLRWTAGLAMATRAGAPSEAPIGSLCPARVVAETDQYSIIGPLFNDPREDYWYWDYFAAGAGAKAFDLTVPRPDAASPATLALEFFSVTATGVPDEHHARITVNGQPVGEGRWTGTGPNRLSCAIPAGVLLDGANTVAIEAVSNAGVPYSTFYFNRMTLDYVRQSRATADRLLCAPPASGQLTAQGFSLADIAVYDVSAPYAPVRLAGVLIEPDDAGQWQVRFEARAGARFALDAAPLGPTWLQAAPVVDLTAATNRADYLILTTPALRDAADRLAAHRAINGWGVRVVLLEEIYNAFGDGEPTLEAVRSFLRHARARWALPPAMVLLAGAGTYDYRGLLGDVAAQVPVPLVGTPQSVVGWDGWFTDLDDDAKSDLPIGRLPARNAAELDDMVDKLVAYETAATSAWQRTVVLGADNSDHGGRFTESSERVRARLATDFTATSVYLDQAGALTPAREAFRAGIDNGALFVTYFGHGAIDRLSQEQTGSLFGGADVALLANAGRPAIFLLPSCQAGNHANPYMDSLAEALVRKPEGGAIAVWAPAGQSMDAAAAELTERIYSAVFESRFATLGEALQWALDEYARSQRTPYLLRIYNVMGDPALRLAGRPAARRSDWQRTHFSADEWLFDGIGGWTGDADRDGADNLREYAFGNDPRGQTVRRATRLAMEGADGFEACFEVPRRQVEGLVYRVEISDSVEGPWTDAADYIAATTAADAEDPEFERVIYRLRSPGPRFDRAYIRLTIQTE